MGYFLSVLLTIPARRDLAIAGFVIIGLFPIISAFADYALMKWSYLISGFLVIGGLFFSTVEVLSHDVCDHFLGGFNRNRLCWRYFD
jgi:hypothetical protein